MEPETLLTAAEVADLLRVDISSIHRWARAGDIPSVMIGQRRRFSPSAIARLVAPTEPVA